MSLRAALLTSASAAALSQALPPVPPLPPNPLAGVVAALRAWAAAAPAPAPTGLDAAAYLETILPIVQYFVPLQDATGRIIDPDPAVAAEKEYATPCFAHAAATLVSAGGHDELLAPASLALTASLGELAAARCATASCDFFAMPVMRTYALLGALVAPATRDAWTALLRNISLSTWEFPGQNWELTAALGELSF